MATIQESSNAAWRRRFQPARYGNAEFHVEQQARSSGRRVAMHEYPKRDNPYAEDMGRHAIRYSLQGYIIGPNYHIGKERLIAALEDPNGKPLMDPYRARELICICERYSVTEVRERGGYCVFDMIFCEAGTPGNSEVREDTHSTLQGQADKTGQDMADNLDDSLGAQQ